MTQGQGRAEDERRIAALEALEIFDTPQEREFDEIVEHVAASCETPMAIISLIGEDRQWFKASVGMEGLRESPIEESICLHALREGDVLEIPDAANDLRTADNPFVTGERAVRFYAGAPLRTADGIVVGTLCVLDSRPRNLSPSQRATLRLFAQQVIREIELRRALSAERKMLGEIDHRVKNSLQMVMAYLRLQRRKVGDEAAAALEAAEHRVAAISMLHAALNAEGAADFVNLSGYLSRIVGFLEETLPEGVRLELDLAPVRFEARRAAAIGQIVNEFVTNSSKYAFPAGRSGVVRIRGRWHGDSYRLDLSDDGVGMPPDAGRGLGLDIIETAAHQVGATLERPAEGSGARLNLVFARELSPSEAPSVQKAG